MKKSNSKTDVTNISDDALIQEVSAAESTERISAEEVNEIMAKYDRESAVRVFSGNKALFVKLLLEKSRLQRYMRMTRFVLFWISVRLQRATH